MSKVLTVAWRDFKQTVFRKAFLIAIVGIPLVLIALFGLMAVLFMTHREPPLVGTLAIVDPTGEVSPAAEAEFDPERIAQQRQEQIKKIQEQSQELMGGGTIGPDAQAAQAAAVRMGFGQAEVDVSLEHHEQADEAALQLLKNRILSGELLAVAVMPPEVVDSPDPSVEEKTWPKFDLFVSADLDDDHASFVERRLGQAVVRARAARIGLDPDEASAIFTAPQPNTRRILEGGQEASEGRGVREFKQFIPMAFMMLLFIGTFTAAQHLMMSTIEEKSNRVMEVLLSAVSPLALMTGKIIGQGGVGLLLVGIYSSLALMALITFDKLHYIEPIHLVYLFLYFFMAYFMVASMMAAVGSAVTDLREANTLVTPVMMLVWVPWILWLPISQAPNGAIATIFSFVPPATPFVMALRIGADEPVPFWQIPATIVWGYICVLAMVWMAAKIFRIGVLMYGKPPSPVQLLKWLRYS